MNAPSIRARLGGGRLPRPVHRKPTCCEERYFEVVCETWFWYIFGTILMIFFLRNRSAYLSIETEAGSYLLLGYMEMLLGSTPGHMK